MTSVQIDLVFRHCLPLVRHRFMPACNRRLTQLPDVAVNLTWRAFELNPDPHLVPEPILPALCKKVWCERAADARQSAAADTHCQRFRLGFFRHGATADLQYF